MSITSVRHCRCISEAGICSAAAGDSWPAAGGDQRCPGARAGHSVRLHPGIRQLVGQLRLQRRVTLRAGRLARDRQPRREIRRALSESVLAGHRPEHAGRPRRLFVPDATTTTSRRGWRCRGIRPAASRRRCTPPTASTTTTPSPAPPAFSTSSMVQRPACVHWPRDSVRRDRRCRSSRGTRRGHILPESAAGSFPSLVASIDPDLKTPYAHHFSTGLDRQLPGRVGLDCELRVRARLQSARHDRLQPRRAFARCRSPPARRRRSTGNICLGAAIHRVRRNLVPRPDGDGDQAVQSALGVSGQLHAVESEGQLHGLPEHVSPARQRARTRSGRPERAAARFRS